MFISSAGDSTRPAAMALPAPGLKAAVSARMPAAAAPGSAAPAAANALSSGPAQMLIGLGRRVGHATLMQAAS